MPPKTRAYTKEELQGLRRADLQRLCKVYDIKGANAKSDALIDVLVEYFNSSAYLASPKVEGTRFRPSSKAVGVRSSNAPARPRQPQLSSATGARSAASKRVGPASACRAPTAQPPVATQEVTLATNLNAPKSPNKKEPSSSTAPFSVGAGTSTSSAAHTKGVPPIKTADRVTSATVDQETVTTLRRDLTLVQGTVAALESRLTDAAIEARFQSFMKAHNQRHMALIEARETAVKEQEQALDAAWARLERAMANQLPHASSMPAPDSKTADVTGGKRKSREGSPSNRPEPKRLCKDDSLTRISGDGLSEADSQAMPRTPSPSLKVTGITSDLRAQPPAFAATPSEHRQESPTMSRPSSNSGPPPLPYGRIGAGGVRPHHDRNRRKVSQAHIDLSTITESRAVSDGGPDAPFLGPIVAHKRATSPTALSPSPSIGGDNFTYTPQYPQPRDRRSSNEASASVGFSPGREYMNVALNGHWDPEASPSANATPSSRTMMGTERFRDRRFADEVELVPWATPKVDFGQRSSGS